MRQNTCIKHVLQNSSPLLLDIKQMNYVHSYDKEERLFQNCEIHGPWFMGFGVRGALNEYNNAPGYYAREPNT